jgi:hypothetical protein
VAKTQTTKARAVAIKTGKVSDGKLTAKNFISTLEKHQSDKELQKIQRYFKTGEK